MQDLQLLDIEKWTSLKLLSGKLNICEQIGERLYFVGSSTYLIVSNYKGKSLATDPGAPFIVGVMWAADNGAALRATNFDIESDQGASGVVPKEFFPFGVDATYGQVKKVLKSVLSEEYLETAIYRIAKDGAFVHRSIESKSFAFFFREREARDDELPYAVIYKLSY
ncbi:hypothetical protein [Chitinivorax sp. B]|uniref:hypothetical protein n=1 Tax=Chitinivorax sp. B TaxID=2502235 RepID=UPI0010F55BCC|nr:hypothetical protein [Chitinivorax sp. B]